MTSAFRFGAVEVRLATREVVVEGAVVHVEPQVFDVLVYLIRARDRVVPKSELLEAVWGDTFVSESALTSRVKSARRAVGDDGQRQRSIKTVRSVGYRFVADVEESVDVDDVDVALRPVPPVQPLVGRNALLTDVSDRVGSNRLLTLVGPGGIGKTHLAMHVAAAVADRFDNGVRLVELADLSHGVPIESTLSDAIGSARQVGTSPIESIVRHLSGRELLLILDNAEHVRHDVGRVSREIVRRCPRVSVLVTSRERLGVSGEQLVEVGPLEIGGSVELFARQAEAHAARIDPTSPAVRQLCERLDGMPLAILIAAARTRLLSVADIGARLEHHLAVSPFEPVVDDRHATLVAALEWSMRTLSPGDREALAALSLMQGSFAVDDASAVLGRDAVDVLGRLVERSLVQADPGPEASRFRLLEPIRMYVTEDRPSADVVGRYVEHFITSAEGAQALILGGDPDAGLAAIRDRWPNYQRIVQLARERTDHELISRLVVAVGEYAEMRLATEIIDWALVAAGEQSYQSDDGSVRSDAVAVAVRLLAHIGARTDAADVALRLESAPRTVNTVLARLWLAWYRGDLEAVESELAWLEEHTTDSVGLIALAVRAIRVYAVSLAGRRDPSSTDALRHLADRSGATGEPFGLLADAVDAYWEGEHGYSIEVFHRAIRRADELGFALLSGGLASYRSVVIASHSEREDALSCLAETLAAALDSGRLSIALSDLAVAALLLAERNCDGVASRLLGVRHSADYHANTTEIVAAMAAATIIERDAELFDQEFEIGQTMEVEEGIRLAVDRLRSSIAMGAASPQSSQSG